MKKLVVQWCLGISLVFIMGCSVDPISEKSALDKSIEPVPLASYKVTDKVLSFVALSNGCSENSDFTLKVDDVSENQAQVNVIRLHSDNCKRMPFLNTFHLQLDKELSGKKIRVLNPKLEFVGKSFKK